MHFERLKLQHIDMVTTALWQRGIVEAMVFGVRDYEDLHAYARQRLEDSQAHAAVLDDGRAIAIFGAFPDGMPGLYTTWFMATEEFSDHFLALTKRLRKLIDEDSGPEGITMLQTFSACVHPMAPKWFSLLGLQEDSDYTDGNHGTVRRFFREMEPVTLED